MNTCCSQTGVKPRRSQRPSHSEKIVARASSACAGSRTGPSIAPIAFQNPPSTAGFTYGATRFLRTAGTAAQKAVGMFDMAAAGMARLLGDEQDVDETLDIISRTADIDRPITYEQMADDSAAVLHHLDVGNADVVGPGSGSSIGRSGCWR